MSLSKKETKRIDEIEKAVRDRTPVEELNEKERSNHSFESLFEENVLMGDMDPDDEDEEDDEDDEEFGKNGDEEIGGNLSPRMSGYMIQPPRSRLKVFLKKLFDDK